MRKLTLGIALLLLATACGGGGDDNGGDDSGGTTTTASDAGQSTTTTTSSSGDDGPGANTEFCGFDDQFDDVFDSALTLSPQGIEDAMQTTLQLANQAADTAPSAIRDDVNLLLGGFSDLVDALADIDYDVINNFDAFNNDPRVMNLDSPEYEAASQAIDDYCGDGGDDLNDGVSPPTIPGTDITVPGSTDGTLPPGIISDDLPDNFPAGLVPPGNVETQTINVGPGYQVTFTTDASFDDVVASYTAELGAPTSTIVVDGASSATWFQSDGTIIVVQESDDGTSAVVAGAN